MNIKITEVTVYPVKPQEGLVAVASFVMEGIAFVGSIGIYTKRGGGYRLSYPIKKVGGNRWEIFKPINREFNEQIENAILEEYNKLLIEGVTEIVEDE